MSSLLFTGWTGYIGSHTVVEFQQAGYEIIVIDDGSNSSPDIIDQITQITGKAPVFYKGSIADITLLNTIFEKHPIDAVVHFAGFKAVGESCQNIASYHVNNVSGTVTLLGAMRAHGVKKIIFSSSATVYDANMTPPWNESAHENTTNPYGTTKLVIEKLIRDYVHHAGWQAIILRYFNPIWAHSSGIIWEYPRGVPNNLMPYLLQVISGERAELQVFGDDYPTADGSGVRDYIHVTDLARGHLRAYQYIQGNNHDSLYEVFNLWTGKGTSVLEMIAMTQSILGRDIPYRIVPRRPGDIAMMYADPTKAEKILWWRAEKTIEEAIRDGLHFIWAL